MFITSGILTAAEGMSYVDGLYYASSITSSTGLVPLDFSTFSTGSIVYTCFILTLTSPILTAAAPMFIRRMYFKRQLDLFSAHETMEYRALNYLLCIIAFYFIVIPLSCMLVLGLWAEFVPDAVAIIKANSHQSTWSWSIFHVVSSFHDAGLSTFTLSFVPWNEQPFVLLMVAFLTLAGNTAFPLAMRLMVYAAYKMVPAGRKGPLKYLLDHPRRCFTHLFLRKQSWWLFFILLTLNTLQFILFLSLDFNSPSVVELSVGNKIVNAIFTAVVTRTSGFNSVDLATLSPAMLVILSGFMYISSTPVVATVRKTDPQKIREKELKKQMKKSKKKNKKQKNKENQDNTNYHNGHNGNDHHNGHIGQDHHNSHIGNLSHFGHFGPIGHHHHPHDDSHSVNSHDNHSIMSHSHSEYDSHDEHDFHDYILNLHAHIPTPRNDHLSPQAIRQRNLALQKFVLLLFFKKKKQILILYLSKYRRETSLDGSTSRASSFSRRSPYSYPATPRSNSYVSDDDNSSDDPLFQRHAPTDSFRNQARTLLIQDSIILFTIFILICIIEDNNLKTNPNYSIFKILFELTSAYGTVGLSLGYPGVHYSFSGVWSPGSKVLISMVMLLGRHRGLPLSVDRAVQLQIAVKSTFPSETDLSKAFKRKRPNHSFNSSPAPELATQHEDEELISDENYHQIVNQSVDQKLHQLLSGDDELLKDSLKRLYAHEVHFDKGTKGCDDDGDDDDDEKPTEEIIDENENENENGNESENHESESENEDQKKNLSKSRKKKKKRRSENESERNIYVNGRKCSTIQEEMETDTQTDDSVKENQNLNQNEIENLKEKIQQSLNESPQENVQDNIQDNTIQENTNENKDENVKQEIEHLNENIQEVNQDENLNKELKEDIQEKEDVKENKEENNNVEIREEDMKEDLKEEEIIKEKLKEKLNEDLKEEDLKEDIKESENQPSSSSNKEAKPKRISKRSKEGAKTKEKKKRRKPKSDKEKKDNPKDDIEMTI